MLFKHDKTKLMDGWKLQVMLLHCGATTIITDISYGNAIWNCLFKGYHRRMYEI